MCDNRNSNEKSPIDEAYQLIDADSIKEEPDIKEEPQSVGDLVETTHSDHRGDEQSIDLRQLGNEDSPMNLSTAEVKIEVKNETSENTKNDKKSNNSNENRNEEETNNHRGHSSKSERLAVGQQFNQNGGSARKSSMPIKGNTLAKPQQQHQCEQCVYSTNLIRNLKRHLVTHTGEKPFPCDRCEKAFKSKQYLQNHVKMHAEGFEFHCAVCLKGFDQKNEKIEHEIHCNTLRYECHLCDKTFGSFKIHLIQHMRVHSGSKPFECEKCPKQFTRQFYLKRHMKLHGGPCSFRCSICHEGFAQQNEMIEHELKCNRRVYECYVCGKSFGSQKSRLVPHMIIHTGIKSFKCDQCPLKFAQKSHLSTHIRIHSRSFPWKCVICRQGFPMQTQCKAHQRNCRRRVYACYVCKKFFGSNNHNLMRHMMTHDGTGEKPFRCEICSNRFVQKQNLSRHVKNIHNKTR